MSYELRPTQVQASKIMVDTLHMGKGGSFVYGSCGWGKSVLIADVASKLDKNVLVLQPSKELLIQNYNKMLSYGVDGVTQYSASVNKKDIGKITYATIGSIKDYDQFRDFGYILIDEAHCVSPKDMTGMYGKFFRAIGNPPFVGLTGTPYRLEQKFVKEKCIRNGEEEIETFYTSSVVPLNRIPNRKAESQGLPTFIFGKMIYKIEMLELMDQKWLVTPEYDLSYAKEFDYSKLKMNTTGSNFDEKALEAFVNSPNRLKQAYQACMDSEEQGINSNLVFCSTVTQSEKLAGLLKGQGVKAEYISAKHTPKERKRIIDGFKGGDIKHLINYQILHVGFDMPHLEQVTNARPIISPEKWVQICGRVIRVDPANPGKKSIIKDVAGVSRKLGRAETIRMVKEQGGFKDEIVSEVGILSNRPLFKFRVEAEQFKKLA